MIQNVPFLMNNYESYHLLTLTKFDIFRSILNFYFFVFFCNEVSMLCIFLQNFYEINELKISFLFFRFHKFFPSDLPLKP